MLTTAVAAVALSAGLAVSALPGALHVQGNVVSTFDDAPVGLSASARWALDLVDKLVGRPQPSTSFEDKSIYDLLSENPDFSKLKKLIDYEDDIVDLLKDTSTELTFFAPPNWALKPPGKHEKAKLDMLDPNGFMVMDPEFNLIDAMNAMDELEADEEFDLHDCYGEDDDEDDDDEDDDDDEKERRKKILKKIIRAVLLYHVLPEKLESTNLLVNTTHATNLSLSDDSLIGQPLRLRVAPGPFVTHLFVNFYAKIVKADVRANNGIIHVINHPLLPPPSIFQELFNFPKLFSIATSAIQRVHLTRGLEWRYVPNKDSDENGSLRGSPAVTFFAPSNNAFKRLPEKLVAFLFSPFGEKALAKVLAYHVVPEFVLHSDYIFNATSASEVTIERESTRMSNLAQNHPPVPSPKGPPLYAFNLTLPTLLPNSSLHVDVAKRSYKLPGPHHRTGYVTQFLVNGGAVFLADTPARNGAVHVIGKVLDPRKASLVSGEAVFDDEIGSDWEDWESWLPQWAEE